MLSPLPHLFFFLFFFMADSHGCWGHGDELAWERAMLLVHTGSRQEDAGPAPAHQPTSHQLPLAGGPGMVASTTYSAWRLGKKADKYRKKP